MTDAERAVLRTALDKLLDGEKIAVLVGNDNRPTELVLARFYQDEIRGDLVRSIQIRLHKAGPDADGYDAAKDAAGSYDAAIHAKRESAT